MTNLYRFIHNTASAQRYAVENLWQLRHILLAAVIMSLLFCGGCNKSDLDTEYVCGTVTLDGAPLGKTKVFFNPVDGGGGIVAHGVTDDKGFYKLTAMQGGGAQKGTVPGDYRITLSKTESILTNPNEPNLDLHVFKTNQLLPLVYYDTSKTPFTITVVKGKNEFNFDLTTKAK